MKNQKAIVKTAIPTSDSNGTEKKVWRQPQLTQLNIKETKGGYFPLDWESPFNVFSHS